MAKKRKKHQKTVRLGIDFGTTRTVVASVEEGNYPVCTFSWREETKDYIPSLVAIKKGKVIFGWEAMDALRDPEARALRSIKRLAGRLRPEDTLDLSPGVSFTLLDLLTLFFCHLRDMIIYNGNLLLQGRERMEVEVATPANANSNQRYMTMEAFQRAGFKVIGAMNEPTAAAVEFFHRNLKKVGPKSPKKYVAVYDLGGGTFDTSLVGLADRNFDVIANQGMARLGGDDFDEVILDLALEAMGRSKEDLNAGELVQLLEECRERKEGLKANTRKMVVDPAIVFPGEGPVVLGTDQVYKNCGPLIQRSLDELRQIMERLPEEGIDPEDTRALAAIYLVGGSVSFPPVSRRLREDFPTKVKVSPYPHAATAIGLAVASDPLLGVRVRESVSRYFGLWREHEEGLEKIFDPIFFKDKTVDLKTGELRVSRVYHPVHNIGHFRFLECSGLGKAGEPEGDIILL
ncbi:MAG TPA: Hsp70 family protein, partial [Thermodesulfobacteriota bacterium]|nr:Hsp70 family protein [Thermodesulfobacteriota bacterium]